MITLANSGNAAVELEGRLANYLLSLGEGEQLLSTRDLAETHGVSMGSISSTINRLEDIGAAKINRRGRLGSFLEQRSLDTLWSIAEKGPMVIALTLPSFPKCEGLATALHSLLNNAGVETYLTFIRGSHNRISALRSGQCHAVVMSELAADELSGEQEEVTLRLPPQSFVTDHRVFYRRGKEGTSQPLTVGIDHDSFDIEYLTELEFADNEVVFRQMTFTQTDLYFQKSSVDAAISNYDHVERLVDREFSSRPLSQRVQALIGDRDTSAAVVIRSESDSTRTVIKEVLDPEEVVRIQEKVVAGQLVPRY